MSLSLTHTHSHNTMHANAHSLFAGDGSAATQPVLCSDDILAGMNFIMDYW